MGFLTIYSTWSFYKVKVLTFQAEVIRHLRQILLVKSYIFFFDVNFVNPRLVL